jgi:probable addiction module antidote protein
MKNCSTALKTDDYELLSYRDLETEILKKNPKLEAMCIESEFEEYLETGDPFYLQKELRTAVRVFGRRNFERKTGLAKKTIYNVLNGKTAPKFEIILKFLDALGYDLKLNLVEKTDGSAHKKIAGE